MILGDQGFPILLGYIFPNNLPKNPNLHAIAQIRQRLNMEYEYFPLNEGILRIFPQKELLSKTLNFSPASLTTTIILLSIISTYINDEASLPEHHSLGPVSGDVSVDLLPNERAVFRQLTNQTPAFTWPFLYHLTL